MSSLDYNSTDEQQLTDLDTIRKKLNNAFLSHFSTDNSSQVIPLADAGEKLLEIVSDCVNAKASTFDNGVDPSDKTEVLGAVDELVSVDVVQVTAELGLQKGELASNHGKEGLVPDIFSDAFGDVDYQSVDLDIVKDNSASSGDKMSSHYSQIVSDVLKKTPKASRDTLSKNDLSSSKNSIDISSIWDDGPEDLVVAENKPKVLLEKKVISKKLMNAEKVSASDSSLHFVSSSTFSAKKNSSALSLEKLKQKVFTEVSDRVEKKNGTSSNSNIFTPAKMEPHTGRNIALLYNEKHLKHESGPLSMKTPECPERLIKAMWHLKKSGVFDDESCSLIDAFDAVDESYILQVHDESYVRFVDSYAKAGGGFLGDSTYVVSESCNVAKCSAGGAIKAGDLVADGLYSYSFAMMRPPGHHASKGKYGGFCLFNNAAILAKYLQNEKKIGKVMIIDWDAHAGDGTMDIFYDDTTVLFVSLHRDPHGFYPRKGFIEETGAGAGAGYTVNIEMPLGSGDAEYIFAFDEVVVPLMDNFSPDFIICSCGFDAHYKEKNIGLNMTSEGYYQMTLRLSSKYPKNLAFLMEGGYHDFNGQLCHSVLNALLGKPNPTHDQVQVSSFKLDQQKQIFGQTQAKIAQLKKIIPLLS